VICVVVLQNCIDFVEGETGPCSETCVTCDADGNEEVSIKVEESIDMKVGSIIEVEEAKNIKDEFPEVRFLGVCEVVAAHAFRPFIVPPKKQIVKLHLTISCCGLYCGCHIPFEIWLANLKRRDF